MLDFWDVLIISAMVHETHIINFAIEIIFVALDYWQTGTRKSSHVQCKSSWL